MSQNHFTLVFPLKSPADAQALAEQLPPMMPALFQAADAIGRIHYSRFTILDEKILLFLGDFDGEFGELLADLAKSAGPVFDSIFAHVENPPPTPVANHADAFVEWTAEHLLHAATVFSQGFILRGYRMPMVRHFLLSVGEPANARALLGRLASGDESDAPQITTALDWHVGFAPGPGDNPADAPRRKPDYCLNLGITWPGMIALEVKDRVPTISFKSFGAFIAGAAERAKLVGDTGGSGPENWIGGFGRGSDHVLLTLHAISPEAMASYSDRLSALFAEGDAFREIWRADGMAIVEMKDGQPVFTSKVHFGYTDGISMTTIRGGPERYPPDHQEPCEPWLFVLLDEAENYFVPEPPELGRNGSFAVFKMITTDVVAFENLLQSNKDKIDPELLAAKMCGRWRNGVPLALSPDTDSPSGGIPPDQMNNFEYVNADGSGDPKGLRCPVGAHVRRINPRGQPITGQSEPGGSNNTHRLIRRGMPYGPAYDPTQADDGIERGLLGYFINSSIENQYEFVLGHWVNDSEFAGSVRLHPQSKDPMIGTQDPSKSIFVIPQTNGAPPIKITGFSSFIRTKAAAYCFLPSITAVKFISKLRAEG